MRLKRRRAKNSLRRMLGKAVCVAWMDACSVGGWENRTEVLALSECETLGWLIAFDRKVINVAQSRSDTGNTTEVMVIPRSTVRAIKRVR